MRYMSLGKARSTKQNANRKLRKDADALATEGELYRKKPKDIDAERHTEEQIVDPQVFKNMKK